MIFNSDQIPHESKRDTVDQPGSNRYVGSSIVCIMPIAGESIDMIRNHAGSLYDSFVRGVHCCFLPSTNEFQLEKDILIIADDFRPPHMDNGKEIPCLSHTHSSDNFEEPYLYDSTVSDILLTVVDCNQNHLMFNI